MQRFNGRRIFRVIYHRHSQRIITSYVHNDNDTCFRPRDIYDAIRTMPARLRHFIINRVTLQSSSNLHPFALVQLHSRRTSNRAPAPLCFCVRVCVSWRDLRSGKLESELNVQGESEPAISMIVLRARSEFARAPRKRREERRSRIKPTTRLLDRESASAKISRRANTHT